MTTQDDVPLLIQWMDRLVRRVRTSFNDPYVVNVEDGHEGEFGPWLADIIESDSATVYDTEENGGDGVGFIIGTNSTPFKGFVHKTDWSN